MGTTTVLLLAFAIGLIGGLRSLTAPAVVSWAAHWNWLHVKETAMSFMALTVTAVILTVAAVGELVADKLPNTPSRTAALGIIARLTLGGLSGATLCVAGGQSLVLGAVLGAAGGLIGAFVGYKARTGLVRALKVPDLVIALLEDAVAIGGAFLIVSRF
jgi:uncharacterized membrane protein